MRAFFDAEAYVNDKRICVQCVNKKGILQIHELLKQFNIESSLYTYRRENPNWNVNYHLVIQKKHARNIFLKTLGFNHKEKMRKLNANVA